MTSPGKTHVSRALRLASALALVVAAAACSGASVATSAPAASQPPSTAAATAAAAPSSAASAGAGCGADALAAITKQLVDPAITSITIMGGCHQASIETSLAAADVTKGLAFCDGAAAVGYIAGVSSITVQAQTGKELAAGVKGSPCIGEP